MLSMSITVLFRVLTPPKLGGSIVRCGLIIEPLLLIRNQELPVSIPNWPPPRVAIVYEVTYMGNYVHRVENAAILPEEPSNSGADMITGLWHLADALESLGMDAGGAWAGLIDLRENDSARVVAWRL